MIFIAKMCKQ